MNIDQKIWNLRLIVPYQSSTSKAGPREMVGNGEVIQKRASEVCKGGQDRTGHKGFAMSRRPHPWTEEMPLDSHDQSKPEGINSNAHKKNGSPLTDYQKPTQAACFSWFNYHGWSAAPLPSQQLDIRRTEEASTWSTHGSALSLGKQSFIWLRLNCAARLWFARRFAQATAALHGELAGRLAWPGSRGGSHFLGGLCARRS